MSVQELFPLLRLILSKSFISTHIAAENRFGALIQIIPKLNPLQTRAAAPVGSPLTITRFLHRFWLDVKLPPHTHTHIYIYRKKVLFLLVILFFYQGTVYSYYCQIRKQKGFLSCSVLPFLFDISFLFRGALDSFSK